MNRELNRLITETAIQTEKRLRKLKYIMIFISCVIGFWGTYFGSIALGLKITYSLIGTAVITTFLVYVIDQTTDLILNLRKKGKKDVDSNGNRNG